MCCNVQQITVIVIGLCLECFLLIHAHIHTYIHNTYIHIHIHIYIHTYMHTYIHTYVHICVQINTEQCVLPSICSFFFEKDKEMFEESTNSCFPIVRRNSTYRGHIQSWTFRTRDLWFNALQENRFIYHIFERNVSQVKIVKFLT